MAITALARRKEQFTKVVLDPPRAGAKGIDHDLALLGAQQILYVSCNPPTLARDLAALTRRGYKLTEVYPFDLFPQTFHLETLAVLKRQ
jgi:23S rRNA (uracil1939-C5)-methyltransferase